ncbi:MAG TPA: hypothetical protein VFD57_08115 [Clostridia bacterium]|nr:hypothetical protein [Clostridia bacterium]
MSKKNKMSLEVNLADVVIIVDKTIKDTFEEMRQDNESITIMCFQAGYLTGCKALLHSILPNAYRGGVACNVIKEKIDEIDKFIDSICNRNEEAGIVEFD